MNLVIMTVGKVIKPLFNIGIGQIWGVNALYKYVWGHFGLKGVQMTEVDGFKLYVICRDWAVAPAMMFAHSWEIAETEIFKKYIKTGMTVIDAGAYIGYYTILSSRLVGEEGKVYAFEPSPESREVLYKNIKLNNCNNVQVVGKAVSDKEGFTTFYMNPHNVSGSTMFKDYSTVSSHDPQVVIPVTTLDEVVGDKKVDFIKMDIEGGETKALKGMLNIIKNNPELKMIIEVFPIGLKRVGSSLEEFVGFLQSYFNLYIVGKDGVSNLQDIQKAVKKTAVINLFCERKQS